MDVVRGIYDGLTRRQRCSAINLLYVIALSSGASENAILKNVAFNQTVLTLNVKWEDCKRQLETHGEKAIYYDLNGINDSVITMLLLSAFQLVVSLSDNPNNINPVIEEKFLHSLGRMGYSEEKINQELEKIMLMAKMFS